MTIIALLLALAQPGPMSTEAATDGPIAEFVRTCDDAGRRLWGRPLCAPIVIVNRETGAFRTSEPAPGPLPALRANTAFDWGGRKWVMILGPLPGDETDSRDLIFHETWHVHQRELGFPANSTVAAHLDSWHQRYLLRLEWNALAAALRSSGIGRLGHVRQALAFRARRLAAAPAALHAEREQMRHEGLAAYTGVALSGAPVTRALAGLAGGPQRSGLGRSFAYVSGPAWGLLLDVLKRGWRRDLRGGSDLPDLLGLRPAARPAPDLYGGTPLLQAEQQRGLEREARVRTSVEATAASRSLHIPLTAMQMDFDPNDVSTAPDGSTIYHRITLRDQWGRISVSGVGLRVQSDFQAAFAQWPLPGGALELAPGWDVVLRQGGGAELVRPK